MKIQQITIDPDPYKPFRLAQGYRVGELLFISGQAAIDGNGQLVGVGTFDAQAQTNQMDWARGVSARMTMRKMRNGLGPRMQVAPRNEARGHHMGIINLTGEQ